MYSSFQELLGHFNQTTGIHKAFLVKVIKSSNEGPCTFQKIANGKNTLRISFSRTTKPISTKLCTINICCLFPRKIIIVPLATCKITIDTLIWHHLLESDSETAPSSSSYSVSSFVSWSVSFLFQLKFLL